MEEVLPYVATYVYLPFVQPPLVLYWAAMISIELVRTLFFFNGDSGIYE
jgi:hypothetical protein